MFYFNIPTETSISGMCTERAKEKTFVKILF